MAEKLPVNFTDQTTLTIPPSDNRPAVAIDMGKIREGETRLLEARVVNPATYTELEFTFNESYREAKKNLSAIGYEITQAERQIRHTKSIHLIDEYPSFIKENRLNDNTANREAFLERQSDYVEAVERLNQLKALESLMEGKIKVFENVCRYMRKSMDLIIRSGINSNKY